MSVPSTSIFVARQAASAATMLALLPIGVRPTVPTHSFVYVFGSCSRVAMLWNGFSRDQQP